MEDSQTEINSSNDSRPRLSEENNVRMLQNENLNERTSDLSYELQQGVRILNDIMSVYNKGINQQFMNSIESSKHVDSRDYLDVIKKPMWLKKIKEKFVSNEYSNITEFVSDMRLMLENCYRYYGPDHTITKKGIKLEMMMEQKLALLPRELREKTSLEMTSGKTEQEWSGTRRKSIRLGGGEVSLILHHVRHEKAMRDKELRKKKTEERKSEKEGKEKEVIEWEEQLLADPIRTQVKASWELPQIGHFLYLCQSTLNTPEVPQYELERILLMPKEAVLLSRIMTSLLSSPNQRTQLDKKPLMSYRAWTEKLKNKVQAWYKFYSAKGYSEQIVFDHLGIEPQFFKILGSINPLEEKCFHDLTFHQRIWLLKSVCDFILHNHKTIQDVIAEHPFSDQRDYVLGEDEKGNRYLHFPQFCGQDVRIYRQSKWKTPVLDIPTSAIKREKQRNIRRKQQKLAKLRKMRQSTVNSHYAKVAKSLGPQRLSRPSRLRQIITPVVKMNVKRDNPPESEDSAEQSSTDYESDDVVSDSNDPDENDNEVMDIRKFELVVDSVESLRNLIKSFAARKFEWKNKKHGNRIRKPDCAILYDRLRNLLLELEPWELKLDQSVKRRRGKLHKEWLEQKAKPCRKRKEVEEDSTISDDEEEMIWSSEEDDRVDAEEENLSNCDDEMSEESASLSSDETNSSSDLMPESKLLVSRKRKLDEVNLNVEQTSSGEATSEEQDQLASRQKRINEDMLPNGAAKGLLLSHLQQNNASQAKELFAWETLRQILVSPQKEKEESDEKERTKTASQEAYHDTIRSLLLTQRTKPQQQISNNSTVDSGKMPNAIKQSDSDIKLNNEVVKPSVQASAGQKSLVSKRQSTLSIQLPTIKLNDSAALSTPQLALTPSGNLFRPCSTTQANKSSSPTVHQGQQVLTLASTSGTPKYLANVVGPNAQFTHYQLGSPTAKKSNSASCKSPLSVDGNTLKATITKPTTPLSADQTKTIFIPAVDQKGTPVYLKVVTARAAPADGNNAPSTIAGGHNANSSVGQSEFQFVHQIATPSTPSPVIGSKSPLAKSPLRVLTEPPPLAPIGSGPKLKDVAVPGIRHVKILTQPPPLAQIGTHQSNNPILLPGTPTSPLRPQTTIVLNSTKSFATGDAAACVTAIDSRVSAVQPSVPSRLVMLRSGQNQVLGMVLDNGQVVPLNIQNNLKEQLQVNSQQVRLIPPSNTHDNNNRNDSISENGTKSS